MYHGGITNSSRSVWNWRLTLFVYNNMIFTIVCTIHMLCSRQTFAKCSTLEEIIDGKSLRWSKIRIRSYLVRESFALCKLTSKSVLVY